MSEATAPSSGDAAGGSAVASTPTDAPPSLRIVAGNPTDEELAAAHAVILAVLAEQAAHGSAPAPAPVDRWRRSARRMRTPLTPGPGAWAASIGLRGF